MTELLTAIGIRDKKVLILTASNSPSLYLSGRNLPRVYVMRYADATAYEILWSDALVIEEAALAGAGADAVKEGSDA